jgi:hypothetical protein
MRQIYLRLGFYNGLLIGLALAAGAWGLDVFYLGATPFQWFYPTLALGCIALMAIGGLGGWLASGTSRMLVSALIWLATAGVMMWVMTHLPYESRTLIVWLSDSRFRGLPIYPADDALFGRTLVAALFPAIVLVALGLLQAYRLEGVQTTLTPPQNRLSPRSLFLLSLPLPLVFMAGLIADDIGNKPLRLAPQIVAEVIDTGRTYPGNLAVLSRERGISYTAIAGVRDLMSARYTLQIGEINWEESLVTVAAHFDNGAWIQCRVLVDYLSHCYDANFVYTTGFSALFTGAALPKYCSECVIRLAPQARAWQLANRERLAGEPRLTFEAQAGQYVWMHAEWPESGYTARCLFRGLQSIRLETCD